ncbi:alpha/beta hydrolase [Apilactobacillus sp. M161]|uniref:Alpha/beta hydrolase n=1 Tax=Apilactobacillus xinyiensis TaxID=2841032 RepID=A0ABT0I372_9LACO|nr:alpha/beta hydrolase [Apilactobacillus xinyiensis]MCK8625157.1 alpha/beta hydrolase [Apilactobacillus xinyiensis]
MGIKKNIAYALSVPTIMGIGTFLLSEYLFKLGMGRKDLDPQPSKDQLKYANDYYRYVNWYLRIKKETWEINEAQTNDRLVASYIPADENTNRTIIMAHGFGCNRETMANFAKMYHDMGINVLIPDDRAHGESSGKYVTFGWLDRMDYLQWIDLVIQKNGPQSEILLFGISMGAGIVTMLSGEKLPRQVKAIIADCGYTNVADEFNYLLKMEYHLPSYPIEPLVSTINRRRLGYCLDDASCTSQLKKNKLPILFIHGSKDIYVPTYMSYKNYRATKASKQLWIVPGAGHEESFWINPQKYKHRVNDFLNTYYY